MKKNAKKVLIYESKPEISLIFKDFFHKHGYILQFAPNIEQVNFLVEQLKPLLIIINSSDLSLFSPTTKTYDTPILLLSPQSNIEISKNFKKINFYNKPINEKEFQAITQEILDNIISNKNETYDDFTTKWLEEKSENSYNFHYTGSINQNDFHRIFERIEELIAVGRNNFILNLTEAVHLENIAPSSFSKLHKISTISNCHLKIIMKASKLAEALSHEGIDIDQYIK